MPRRQLLQCAHVAAAKRPPTASPAPLNVRRLALLRPHFVRVFQFTAAVVHTFYFPHTRAGNSRVRFLSSTRASAPSDSFASFAASAQRDLVEIQDAVTAAHVEERVAALRDNAADPKLWDDATNATAVLQHLAALESQLAQARDLDRQFVDTKALYNMAAEEQDELMLEECTRAMAAVRAESQQLRLGLVLGHESDRRSCFIEIKAGAGGTDSCDWTAILARMYARWGAARGFHVQHVDESAGDEAGFRSVLMRVEGVSAYGWAKCEAGVHRLVRISPFDSARRRHTSFAQVRVYPMATEGSADDQVEMSTKDVRIDTFRSSGPGGQHVNSTDSAIRITHLPTGIVVQSQSDRSQHRNKAEALAMLRAKLYQRKLDEKAQARHAATQDLGDNAFSNQIRSYVLHPYQLVKDHRTNYSESNTARVLDGGIHRFIEKMLLHKTMSTSSTEGQSS
ncbi:unnamed protein product [Hyaloperonospora brassicae]|uniref:Prokaryotic-type class I peptide chain release factors domain-containing protein n=1 Tax=Hyaloperonospora brassicae TaxID=162125 RepID=A0AAV0TD78_HYABA|nr:unnamed protein product [Hyaloperonospora brassicae]